ncbi:MAG TPA: deoxyribose-phosphate aldolase [Burkholderiaceae bacterium]|nr:deoxyribose-phosphate aldolase [Burkholderiaceae bacterium]
MPPLEPPQRAARLALHCLDLTSLGDHDSEASIDALAARAQTRHGSPAALCVHARFVAAARRSLQRQGLAGVRVATVVNFPHGAAAPATVAGEIEAALAAGADEIDAVFPWRALMAGDAQAGADLVRACRRACDAVRAGVPLKLILETGELRESRLIRQASELAVQEGADFLKTSTGKVPVNATPEAVAVMLEVIAPQRERVGLKVAGGLSNVADVQRYLALARQACGDDWLTPRRLRFGASSLLPVLLAALDGTEPIVAGPAGY